MLVQASCGKCKLGMEGKSCMLAVVIDEEKYYVEGAGDIHDHDAHGKHGMCSTVRKAYVTGEVKDGKYHATHFELVPVGKAD
ncbi:MAG: hypothetical protein HKN92_01545 [Chitinophagales bacterium]|nr:hypothetical protein [Chitinophagales bacterium]